MAAPPVVKIGPPPAKKGSSSTGYLWEAALADALKVPYTNQMKRFFDSWAATEGGGGANNPFNITVNYTKAPSTDLAGNSAHVKNFQTPLDGVLATAKFIKTNVPYIIASLRTSNWAGAADQIGKSGWGGAGSAASYGPAILGHFKGTAPITLGPNVPGALSPNARAQVQTQAATVTAVDKATNQAYLTAEAQLAANKALAKIELRNTNAAARYAATAAQLNDIYVAYTGKPATNKAIQAYIKNPVSQYQLRQDLAKLPGFTQSPAYRQNAPSYEASYKNIYGPNAKVDPLAIKHAIINNLDQTGFQQYLRDQPNYTQSEEYKGQAASYMTAYQSIYGVPQDPGSKKIADTAIQQAVRQGWNSDQWNQYLRAQPAYMNSPDFKAQNINLASRFGLIPGTQAQTMLSQLADQQGNMMTPPPKEAGMP